MVKESKSRDWERGQDGGVGTSKGGGLFVDRKGIAGIGVYDQQFGSDDFIQLYYDLQQ